LDLLAGIAAFFATTLGKITTAIGIGTFLTTIAMFLYFQHDKLVRAEALANFNQLQYQELLKENSVIAKAKEELEATKDALSQELATSLVQRQELEDKLSAEIDKAPDANTLAPEVVRNTIKKLKGTK
jgi:multidrug efflux pump subunit AcrA (membrane-fusion protein)